MRIGPKTWGDLQESTKLSKWSLSVYLKELINEKIVQTRVEDQSGRPPSRIYELNPSPPKTPQSYHEKPRIDPSRELLRVIARNLKNSPGKRKELVRLLVVLNGLDTTHFYEMPNDATYRMRIL